METKNEAKENITAKPDRNEVEGADTGCYRPVNHLGLTPGNWYIRKNTMIGSRLEGYIYIDADKETVVIIENDMPNKDENAKLISAAPDMYEAIHEVLNQKHELDNYVMELCRNALKKAGG